MRYSQLKAFHSVAVCGGFSRAADRLNITQPAISDQVRKLEVTYDIKLFDRSRKQIVLTELGKKLLEITHRLFEIEEQAAEFLTNERVIKAGRLTIIADSTHHIRSMLGRFREKYPEVQISVHSGNSETVMTRLRSYEADIGIMGAIPKNRDFDVTPLSSTPIIAFTARNRPEAKLKTVNLRQLSKLPLVLRERGSRTRSKLEEFARQKGVVFDASFEVEGREAVRDIVMHGGGIGIVSEAEFIEDPSLVKIPISDANLRMDEALVTLRERRDSRLIKLFLPFVISSEG